MNKFIKKAGIVLSMGAGFLGAGVACFAQTYTPDATVSANVTGLVTSLGNAGITGTGIAILAAGVLVVTAALVFWVIRHFRAIAHV